MGGGKCEIRVKPAKSIHKSTLHTSHRTPPNYHLINYIFPKNNKNMYKMEFRLEKRKKDDIILIVKESQSQKRR